MPFDESKSILYQTPDCFDETCSSGLQITVMVQSELRTYVLPNQGNNRQNMYTCMKFYSYFT